MNHVRSNVSSPPGQNAKEDQVADAENAQASSPDAAKSAASQAPGPQLRKKRKKPDPLIGRTIGDRYLIERRIGAGGMGVVYKAKQGAVDRDIAIKVLLAKAMDDEEEYDTLVRRFHLEARAASRLNHPNTITVYDFGQDDGLLYIAMEFLDGSSLEGTLKQGALPAQRAVRIIMQVCHSLSEAHKKNIVHRDIKPDNIFLINMGGVPDFVKVLDFGVAKIRGPSKDKTLTKAGMIFGTPKYMSPEQARCLNLDSRSDIYSVGVMMYQMLTGSVPFDADDHVSILLMHCSEPPEPFNQRRPDIQIPPELEAIVFKAMAKDRDARYQSVDEMSAALEQIAAKYQFVARTGVMPSVAGPGNSPHGNITFAGGPAHTPSGGMVNTLGGQQSGDFNLFDTIGPNPTASNLQPSPISADVSAEVSSPGSDSGASVPLIGKPNPAEVGLSASGSYQWNSDLKLDLNQDPAAAPPRPSAANNTTMLLAFGAAGAFLVLIVIIAGVFLISSSSEAPTTPKPEATPTPPVVTPTPDDDPEPPEETSDAGQGEQAVNDADAPQEPPAPTEVTLTINSKPPGATILVNDEPVADKLTPATITLPYSEEDKATITLRRKQHKDFSTEIALDKDVEIDEQLKRKRVQPVRQPKPNGNGSALPNADDLFKGR